MDQTYRTPGWLTGLLIVFAFATALTFGLFLYKHAEEAAMAERYHRLKNEKTALGNQKNALEAQVPLADTAIKVRDDKLAEIKADRETADEDIKRLLGEHELAMKATAEAYDKEGKTFATLLEDAKRRRLEVGQQEEAALVAERDYDDRRSKARDGIEKTATEIEGIRRDTRRQNADLETRIKELSDRVSQLTQQRELNNRDLKSDGQILAARATDGFVVIDRGHQHNLRKGTRFVVFNRRGGRNTAKGAVEVVDVDARTATARVSEEFDGNDPLVPGDHVHNPVFDPAAVKTFVIAGDFERFSRDELARFISESGGKVEPQLTTSSDYLIAGDRADAALTQASKLGVSILSEDQLLEFVRYRPEFAVRAGMIVVLAGKFTAVSKGKVEDFIEDAGATIGGDVESGVQVLIVGEGAEDEVAQARLLGVTVIDHSQFAHLARD
ncbi:MAG TPA: BRCT domain-containing protein [Planctomycetota bacterium]|nr:BRCT domain-containing protein [Planctomycetota bacterium]